MDTQKLHTRYSESCANQACLKDVMKKTLYAAKGYGTSFRREITDKDGRFDPYTAKAFIGRILYRWKEYLEAEAGYDPKTGTNRATGYIYARLEMYRAWLYIAMQCTMLEGAYDAATGCGIIEDTTFQFLMERADALFHAWCAMAWPSGETSNEPFCGFSQTFGTTFCEGYGDVTPMRYPECITEHGTVKPRMLKVLFSEYEAGGAGDADIGIDEDDDSSDDPYEGLYDEFIDDEEPAFGLEMAPEERAKELDRLKGQVSDMAGYQKACNSFIALFQEAAPEIIHTFTGDLRDMFDLYLTDTGVNALAEAGYAQDLYCLAYDYPFQKAKRLEMHLMRRAAKRRLRAGRSTERKEG